MAALYAATQHLGTGRSAIGAEKDWSSLAGPASMTHMAGMEAEQ
jgi:hypothetical protein